jgi:molybdate transport system substrate-binding protein
VGTSVRLAAIGSAVALALALAGLWWREHEARPEAAPRPLVVYCAAASRVPMEAIAKEYGAGTGRRVELRFGASEDILTKAGMVNPSDPADLFLPADDSYIRVARERGLVEEQIPIATMRAVALAAPGNPKGIAAWPDLLKAGVKVAVPSTAAAAGKLAREHLTATGKWSALAPHVVDAGTVTAAANAAKLGSVDAALVWDAVAAGYTGQQVLAPPELAGVTARVDVAVLKQSADPAAARQFAEYVADSGHGLKHFRAAGFTVPTRAPGARGERK